jgi:hypothetical protein
MAARHVADPVKWTEEGPGCLIHGNENGIFAKSQGWTYGDCHYLTVSHDRIHSNGLAGSDRCHNTYIEGAYTLYEFDDYGALLTGAEASTNLADRGVGTVLRYALVSIGSPNEGYEIRLAGFTTLIFCSSCLDGVCRRRETERGRREGGKRKTPRSTPGLPIPKTGWRGHAAGRGDQSDRPG